MKRDLFRKIPTLLGLGVLSAALWAGDTAIVDGQNAEDVVGQTDGNGVGVFTQGTPFNSQPLKGYDDPYSIAVDTTAHRLFVTDYGANRILVYNLDSNNILIERSADNVLGQTSFYGNGTGTTQSRLYNPYGLTFDSVGNRLFVSDGSNDRVLVFDVASITDGENAVNVLGQSDFMTSSNATAQNRMYLAFSAALDFTGNRLFVSDLGNNRVLIFDIAAITNGENAVNVLGQADFTTGSYARTQGRLREPREISYDPQGNRLFVADCANHRVMVFDVASVTDGENAVNVLGQNNFTAGSTLTTQAGMDYPVGATFDSVTQRLFISHPSGNRVMVFDVATITDGENAVNVIGQGDFTSAVSATTQSGLYNPLGLTFDTGAQRLYVADRYNKRVLMHDVSTTTISNGANAENVVGQTDDVGGGVYTTRNLHDGLPSVGFSNPVNVLVDASSHRLFVSDFNSNRVAVYNLDTSNTLVDRVIDNVLGQSLVTQGLGLTSQSTMSQPQGLAMDLATNRLFVSDYGGDRVMVFDVTTITDGENAVNVLGQSSFTAGASATSQSRLYVPAGLSYEAGDSRLYVADQGNHRVMVFDVASITDGENAVNVLGQSDFTTGTSGLAQNRLASPWGVYHDGASRLYVGDQSNQRVLVFDTTAITDGENAVNVLGQNNFTSNGSGTSQSALNNPKSFAMDTQLNRLFVSDYTNDRVMVFDVAAVTDGENAVNVLGQLNFTENSAATTQSRMYAPVGLSYDPGMNRLYVAEYYNNRMLVHSVGPVVPSSSTLTASTGVGAGKMDLSWASAGDDGAFNNLTGYYRIQYATYTATWSTSTTPTNAYTSTITATNVSPGVVQSTTIVVSPTTPQTWYFVLWTADEVGNWSTISSTATASPPYVIADYGVGPFDVTSVGGGLSQGGTAWGDYDNDGDLDVVVSGTDGTNNQVRVYKSNGNGTFNSTAANVAAANSGLKDGDVAWADFDNDGDLDVLVSGTDNTNQQLRVYRNNGNGTFNTTAVEVAGSNNGLKQGGVAWGDYDNDGDLDVLAGGYDGTNNQLRAYKNNGNATFDATAINVAGSNNGLRAGGVAWGDYDNDADLDVLISGTDGTNRQLRVYANNGNGTFNATATNVAGSNNGLSDGRVAWGDFDKDGDLEVLVSGTDGTNHQLRTYSNNGNGTFNSTANNVAGSSGGVINSAVAVGDFNVDGNIDILAAGRPKGLVGYWKFDENTGTSAADLSGNGYTGTLTNGPTWTTGKYGKALNYNGVNQYVNMGNVLDFSTDDITFGAWINPANINQTKMFIGKRQSSGPYKQYQLMVGSPESTGNVTDSKKIAVVFYAGDAFSNSQCYRTVNDVIDGNWHFVLATRRGATVQIYVDGVIAALTTVVAGPVANVSNPADFNVGFNNSASYFDGKIDEARVYNRVLSAGEIAALYQTTKASVGTLRIHKGVGDGTFNATPVEVDNGLEKGQVAWGDADGDGDLDILTSGSDGTNSQLSVYLSTQSLTASNTTPTAPGTLAGTMGFNTSGVSVASFTWTAGSDSGTGSTSENGLTYDLQISTTSNFGVLMFPGQMGATPRMGSYLKPPKIFNGNTAYGVVLKSTDPWNAQSTASYGLRTDTTYYYQVKTVDAGLATSGWSASGTLNTGVSPSTSTIAASTTSVAGELMITWPSAGDDGMIGNLTGNYRIQYATYTASWSTSTTPTNATTMTISTTNVVPGSMQSKKVSPFTAGYTYSIVLWSQDDAGNWSGVSNTTSGVVSANYVWFDSTQIEVDGLNGGLQLGGTTWGDYDNDGDLDILVSGISTNRELQIYKNNGNGTIDPAQIDVDGANNGLTESHVAWGDYDNDGDLDILTMGIDSGFIRQFRIYSNNGNGTIDPVQIEVDGLNNGLNDGGVAWGDFDNDGDLDILANGNSGSISLQLRIYRNNGNGSIDPFQIEVDGAGGGVFRGKVAWGDYDMDGDLDILSNGGSRSLIYKNNGNGTLNPAEVQVDMDNNALERGQAVWGDYDNDGDLDILGVGEYSGYQLRIYKNNGNGTMNGTQIEVDGINNGMRVAGVAWGDYDNDGTLDILTNGRDSGNASQLRVYKNNGNGTIDSTQIEVDGASNGLDSGGVAWGDFDMDGDLDILAMGSNGSGLRQLRVYRNLNANPNTAPSAPGTLSASWAFNASGISTATFKWNAASDNGTGTTPVVGLNYQVQISTISNFTGNTVVAGQWVTPGMGNYLKPPLIFDGNSNHGVMLRYLPFMNTTYYFRVKSIDAGLKESDWSATQSVYTAAASSAPSAVTDLVANGNGGEGQIVLTWSAPFGVDINSTFDVRYSTTGSIGDDGAFNSATPLVGEPTPWGAGVMHRWALTGLTPLTTYYFGLKTTNANGTSGLDTSTPRPTAAANPFDASQIDIDGANGGLSEGGVAWGDYDGDGDLDALVIGLNASSSLRIYKNNGNGTLDPAQIEVDGVGGGLSYGNVAWGDYDNDGDLDVLASGQTGGNTKELRVYKNNGNGTLDPAQVEVDGAGGGLTFSSVAWGDYDNDGDLDILASGYNTARDLRVYKNNGNGTFDAAQIEIDGVAGGLNGGDVAWGDYDNDGDLDVLASGMTTGNTNELRVYKNNGNGTLDPAQIEVDGAGGGLQTSSVAWGDFDNDGDLDVLASGQTVTSTRELRVYKNNGNATLDAAQVEVDGAGGGTIYGCVAWGDYDNDGDIDILASGTQLSGYTRELRVYRNNGNGTISAAQTEVDGGTGGLSQGNLAWGDYDNDGDVDILANGLSSLGTELRIYKNMSSISNTAPSAPSALTASWDYNASGVSTATFKWDPGTDSGTGSTPANVLTYAVEISSTSGFTGKSVVVGSWSTPGMGNYLRPPKIFDGNSKHGVMLRYVPSTNTTYYYRVKTIDAGLTESAWSATGSLYTLVSSSAPAVVNDLTGTSEASDGQLLLSWTAPLNINSAANASYDVRFSTTGPITNDTEFNNATIVVGEPSPGNPGVNQSMTFSGLVPDVTYYYAIKSSNDGGTSGLDTTVPRANAIPRTFDPIQIEVDGAGGGLYRSMVAWGDYDNDGDLDILAGGVNASTRELRVYKNNGNGTFDANQIEVDGAGGGLQDGGVAWGDYDTDGDLDILVSGYWPVSQLRVYKNNGNGTMDPAQIEVDGAGGGLDYSGVAWGDYDNDGDLDVLASGRTASITYELRVYKNNGNGTLDPAQIEVDGAGGGLYNSSVVWGDYDGDGDLDVLASGYTASTIELRVYKNNGNGTLDPAQVEVDGAGGGLYHGGLAWGDYDNDGDLDILASGYRASYELRIYKNNGNGTLDTAQIEVDGANGGLQNNGVAWGDYDTDGDLDILAAGYTGTNKELRVYKNNGNGTMDPAQIEVDGAGGGVRYGQVAWGDYDNDSDLDILVSGDTIGNTYELRVYKSYYALNRPNTGPTAPGTLVGSYSFNPASVSVASFTWSAGTDTGVGATPENTLTYDIQISTMSNFSKLMFPGQMGASPRMGSYIKPSKTFNGNTYYGVVLKSTDPWNAQPTASYGIRADTTYYYRVKTVDSALAESSWSGTGSLLAAAAPSTSTLAATSGNPEEVTLTWISAGDDGMIGNLTGNYRIQYATYTASWSTSATPTNATTVTISTTNVVPGSAQSRTLTGLTAGLTYYFVLWTQDDISSWSDISNTTATAGGYWFDPNQIEVDGVNNGLRNGRAAWGDFDNDGDLDFLASGNSTYELRIYKNNGNGTLDPTQIEVDGAGGGLRYSGVAWGDHDNDGDLDILASGSNASGNQLRVHKNNGNGTIDSAQIEVDSLNGGLYYSRVAWGDFDNDGDLDILANGWGDSNPQLRVYKNNGNGTVDPGQIEVNLFAGGLTEGSVAWGDFDNDGDLEILTSGRVYGTAAQLRVFKNNGNGTFDAAQIEVDGLDNGLKNSSAVWADFDQDADLDILVSGTDGTNPQLRVYKNNGNGTFDAAQIEVDGLNGGLDYSDVNWGDFDSDGDLDILTSGTDGTNRQLRVYKNNGNATFDASQIEVDGANGGLQEGSVVWGDFDNDFDLDILASGYDGSNSQLRIYKNVGVVANTAPSAPGTLTASWNHNASGISTATFKWIHGVDNGTTPTPENGLTYRIEISTTSGFAGKFIVSSPWATPGMGNYLKPPKIYDGNTTHGVALRYLPFTNTTYYYRVKTVDAGLMESAWSATGNLYTLVASSAPSTVTNLAAGAYGEGQITLTWTAPLNINSGGTASYDIRYSTTAAITNDTEFNNATALVGEPTPGSAGDAEVMGVTGLNPLGTYYFALKSSNSNGTSALDTISPRPSAVAGLFNATQIDVGGLNNGFNYSSVAWGDFDSDGDLDVLVNGYRNGRQLCIYKSNGNGTFDLNQIEVDGVNNGLQQGVVWGDFDNDGDLDILVNGHDGTNSQLRVYKNNGNGTIDPAQIEVDGVNNGLYSGRGAWGDFDNDGDLDILVNGLDGTNSQLRVYKNNGNGTFDASQIEVDGLNNGLSSGGVAWGDFDKDGDLDILVSGSDATNKQLRVYKNSGNGTIDATQIEVDGLNNGLDTSSVAWGDFDSDGDLDILAAGEDQSAGRQLRIFKNNNDGSFDPTQVEVDGAGGGFYGAAVAWGDTDNDGDLDVLASGRSSGATRQLRVYKNNGNATFNGNQIEVERLDNGLQSGGVAWGDFDNDGDLDILASGSSDVANNQLRVYSNFTTLANTPPTAPATLSGIFAYNPAGVSIASMTWSAGTDSGTGATPENVLTYDIQISTVSDFSTVTFPGQMGATPRMGSYLKPPKIFNSNTYYGVVLKSTDPWNAQTTASYGLRTDTTYYYRVKTVDSALAESAWSLTGTLPTGVGPSTSTIASTAGAGEVTLNWLSAGDDGMIGNLTGTYRIQYATFTASWSTSTTPTNATTVTISTTNVVPGSAQANLVTGLTNGLTYYFVLWSGDEVPNWSDVSNTASAWLDGTAPSTSTLAATSGNPEEVTLTWTSAGDDGGSGNLTGNYRIQYATYTVAWSTSSTPTDATTVSIATTTQVPGSAQSHTVTGLTSGLTYYFVLWTGDEVPNWAGISNTTSAVGGYWFDPNQIEVDGAGGGLYNSDVAWGDFDNDGDLDVLASGRQSSGNTKELRIYKNNGNGTIDAAQIEVDGPGGGLYWGGVAWGDYDSDGDLDVLACGSDSASGRQLRIYKNNGNGTMNATQIEVDGTGGGVTLGDVAWGDYDNDGDLDTVMIGNRVTYELRVYKNNGNGTMDPTQIEVDGPAGGLESYSVAWGDYDNDGDLDILANGFGGSGAELRIYKNNGNGTMDAAQIDVDGPGGGVQDGSVAWGDYDNDGDLDVLTNGYAGGTPQLRIYKNNGNGTMDDVQIEVDGAGGGLDDGAVVWGDYDVDGDLDLLTNGYVLQLRVYKNNGNGTMDPVQMDLDGAGGGLSYGSSAWGDYDNDGDLDVLVSGSDGSIVSQLRIYKNLSATANTAPTSPGTLTSVWEYNVLGTSTATFKWAPGSDSGTGATPANALTYQLEISTISNFTGNSVVPGQWSSPGMGNYLKPPKIHDGNTNHGVRLRYLPFTNTTYYYRVKTVDAGLKESAWSATGTLYNLVTSSVASVVTDLVASSVTTSGQALLTWTAPDSINSGGSPAYDVRYRTSGAITTDGEFNGATAATGEPTPGNPGTWESMGISGLVPGVTYYFAIKSSNVNGTSPLDISIPRPSAVARDFDVTPIEVDGAGGGLNASDVAWGDYDSDGDLDILTGGYTGTTRELRIYQNNGNGTINATQIEVDGAGGGVRYSSLAWGDYDNDGDLDILVSGQQTTGTTRELRIYKNNGNGTISATQIEVDGAAGGLAEGAVAWGDYDNDGDLDIIASGSTSTTRELRIYKNNGNGTMNTAQIEVDGAAGGLDYSSVAWGDYDNDGDLDVLGCGSTASAKELRIYKNNGNGTMNATQIEVDGAGGGLDNSGVVWGDYDNDADLDILASGYTGTTRELRVYKNNGNGTLDAAQIDVDGAGGGVRYGRVTWGDYDNDGDLDILSSGQQTSGNTIELRVYKNNGNGTINATQIDVDGSGEGLYWSGVAWGDYDSDGDLDVLANGDDSAAAKQLRIYKSYLSLAQPNTTPAAPGTLSGSFSFNSGSISVASFTWAAGTDSGAGATVENGLTYDLQISTTSNFSKLMFPGQMGASPRMGSYLKPPKIFNSNTYYGVILKSSNPWTAQTTASYGLRTDTTYYYRVKTVDSALADSNWSGGGSAYTGVGPSTSTLAAASTVTDGEVLLTWNSAGDDGMNGNVTGTYRIQYATYTPTWSTSTTPTNATTVTVATTTQVPGSAQSKLITGLTGGLTYYFVLWTGDEVPNWSTISNSTSAVPFVSIRSVTIEGLNTLGFGVVNLGSQVVSSTGVVIRNNGTLVNKYVLSASTQTVGSPWSVKDSTPAGPDAMVIFGLFDDDTAPVLGNFGVEDLIGTIETGSNSSVFSIDGSTTGASVPAGETRKIWIRLDMPTTSRTEAPQTMRIQITAQPP